MLEDGISTSVMVVVAPFISVASTSLPLVAHVPPDIEFFQND